MIEIRDYMRVITHHVKSAFWLGQLAVPDSTVSGMGEERRVVWK